VIIGAQKAGTTALSNMLSSHPEIYMPKQKEMNFFSNPYWYLQIDSYLRHFSAAGPCKYYMEASPGYFWTRRGDPTFAPAGRHARHDMPRSIRSLLGPDVKLIVILRHPTQRAISAFFHHFRMGRVGTADRIRDLPLMAGMIDIGFYSDHLKNYLRVFPQDSLRVEVFEEFITNQSAVVGAALEWLGLEKSMELPKPDRAERNENFVLDRSPDRVSIRGGLAQVMAVANDPRFKKMKRVEPPVVEREDIDYLNAVYANEVEKLTAQFPKLQSLWAR
jgi:hypothetical protein